MHNNIYILRQTDYALVAKHCNTFRTHADIADSWGSLRDVIKYYGDAAGSLRNYTGPGSWNDPDQVKLYIMIAEKAGPATPPPPPNKIIYYIIGHILQPALTQGRMQGRADSPPPLPPPPPPHPPSKGPPPNGASLPRTPPRKDCVWQLTSPLNISCPGAPTVLYPALREGPSRSEPDAMAMKRCF